MQQAAVFDGTTQMTSAEWRWVTILGGLLVTLTLLPYLWAFSAVQPRADYQFTGIFYNPKDAVTYLSKISQGVQGQWQFQLLHTSEPHTGAFINVFYLALGQLGNLLGLSPLLTFHVARLVTGFIMYLSLYHLGSTIWHRLRPRRLFFGLLAIGAGLGWLMLLIERPNAASSYAIDLWIPEAFPFYSTLVNPHFPFAIALIALLASIFVRVFRPGFRDAPSLVNGGLAAALISLGLVIVQPQAWLPLAAALCVYVAVLTLRSHKLPTLEISWVLLVVLPAAPLILYYLIVASGSDIFQVWNAQNITLSPSPDRYIWGYGLLLFVSLPGVWRAVRFFERDGDRLMIIWLVVNVALLYAPVSIQRRFAIGLIIPMVYFVVRSLEDFWLPRIPNFNLRGALVMVLFVFITPSTILSYGLPLFGIANPAGGLAGGLLISKEEYSAIRWLEQHVPYRSVVLAPDSISRWIPVNARLRAVIGHEFETLHYTQKLTEVNAWYREGADCAGLLARYGITYIVARPASPDDVEPGWPEACIQTLNLTPIHTVGTVQIFRAP